jgi:16S rRNA U516 pseudouridylate synthase RsuA-like enzyme
VRVSIAHLTLDNLEIGQWREVGSEELDKLHNLVFKGKVRK